MHMAVSTIVVVVALGYERSWLALGGPFLSFALMSLEKTPLTLYEFHLL